MDHREPPAADDAIFQENAPTETLPRGQSSPSSSSQPAYMLVMVIVLAIVATGLFWIGVQVALNVLAIIVVLGIMYMSYQYLIDSHVEMSNAEGFANGRRPVEPTIDNPFQNPLPYDTRMRCATGYCPTTCTPVADGDATTADLPTPLGDRLYHQHTVPTGCGGGGGGRSGGGTMAAARQFYTVPDNIGCAYDKWVRSLYGNHAMRGRPPAIT